MDSTDCIVVGAGVVGLAVARTLAAAGREVIVLEAEARIGEHTSSRNSEVIHAGLHYKKGSLRQHLLPRAAHLMYAYCKEHGVPHKRLGKLVVARGAEQADELRHHMEHAAAAGVEGLSGSRRRRRANSSPISPATRPTCRPTPASSTAIR